MASDIGLSEQDFNLVKIIVSEYFDDRKLLVMLKVLYRDLVKDTRLSAIDATLDLLNALDESDDLSFQELTLLYDTINVTEQYRLQREIREKFPLFPKVKGIAITSFKSYRQKLVQFGLELTSKDVTMIDGLYNSTPKRYTDSWAMIRDLEHNQIITTKGMKEFINNLEKLGLKQAVSALQEETQDSSGVLNTNPASATSTTMIKYNLSSEKYQQLLVDASKCWKKYGNMYMLKVLLCDCKISITNIQKTDNLFDLFKLLRGSGKISPSNIDAIAEAAHLCGISPMEEVIKNKIPTYPAVTGEIKTFTKYRQNVIEFGRIVSKENLKTIIDLCDLDCDKEADTWFIIFELEINNKLTPKTKRSFVETLTANEMTREVSALSTY